MNKYFLWTGIILSLFFLRSNAQKVYITKTGEKYHTEECRHLINSRIGIELKDALTKGYEPCKVCRPPQGNLQVSQKIHEESSSESTRNKKENQCSAKTSKGTRCKRMTHSANGLCWQHEG